MLTHKEKMELLMDASDKSRKEDFRKSTSTYKPDITFDQYLDSLKNIQELFGPFQISRQIPITSKNKL